MFSYKSYLQDWSSLVGYRLLSRLGEGFPEKWKVSDPVETAQTWTLSVWLELLSFFSSTPDAPGQLLLCSANRLYLTEISSQKGL